jgi:hypothetical protein
VTTHQILNYGQSEDVPVIGNDEDGFVVSTIELFVSSNFVPDHLPFVAFDLPADRRAAVGVRRLLVVGLPHDLMESAERQLVGSPVEVLIRPPGGSGDAGWGHAAPTRRDPCD